MRISASVRDASSSMTLERSTRGVGLGSRRADAPGLGLDRDRGDVVRDRVVQLAGELLALVQLDLVELVAAGRLFRKRTAAPSAAGNEQERRPPATRIDDPGVVGDEAHDRTATTMIARPIDDLAARRPSGTASTASTSTNTLRVQARPTRRTGEERRGSRPRSPRRRRRRTIASGCVRRQSTVNGMRHAPARARPAATPRPSRSTPSSTPSAPAHRPAPSRARPARGDSEPAARPTASAGRRRTTPQRRRSTHGGSAESARHRSRPKRAGQARGLMCRCRCAPACR